MVLSAASAFTLSTNAATQQSQQAVAQDVRLAERAISTAAGRQQFATIFNATLIGNPPGDPVRATLTPNQQTFYDNFVNSGYQVSRDDSTGFWSFRWSISGAEGFVRVYRIRTTVTPGAIQAQTISVINNFFARLIPACTRQAKLGPSGGNITEADFGATNDTFYEYTAIVTQPATTDNHRSALLAALIASGLGYHSTPNVAVYKMI